MFVRRKEFEKLKGKVEELQSKVEELEKMQNEVQKLQNKVTVLDFLRQNPNGFKVDCRIETIWIGSESYSIYYLQYVKDNELKTFILEKFDSNITAYWRFENGFIYRKEILLRSILETKYKFDLEHERLIEIVEEKKKVKTKEPKPNADEKPDAQAKKKERKIND